MENQVSISKREKALSLWVNWYDTIFAFMWLAISCGYHYAGNMNEAIYTLALGVFFILYKNYCIPRK